MTIFRRVSMFLALSSLSLIHSRFALAALVVPRGTTSQNNPSYLCNDVAGSFGMSPLDVSLTSLRGGFGDVKNIKSLIPLKGAHNNEVSTNKTQVNIKVVSFAIITSLAIAIMLNRRAIVAFNFKKELTCSLDNLASLGNRGLIIYTIAFLIWEIFVGVTTPVETAAGMAFGVKKGIIANVIGKTGGAICAFLLGRYVLKDFVKQKLQGNEYMDLVQDSIVKNPLRVSLIWRFSFFPEQVKCFGLAVLPVKLWQYILAVLIHGVPFTLLWTVLGNEMGLIVRGTIAKPTKVLKILIGGVYLFGFFISPSLVGMWIKGLRDAKLEKDSNNKK